VDGICLRYAMLFVVERVAEERCGALVQEGGDWAEAAPEAGFGGEGGGEGIRDGIGRAFGHGCWDISSI
jgi:hypothetical protein